MVNYTTQKADIHKNKFTQKIEIPRRIQHDDYDLDCRTQGSGL